MPKPVTVVFPVVAETVPLNVFEKPVNAAVRGTVVKAECPDAVEISDVVSAAILSTTVIPLPMTRPNTVCLAASRSGAVPPAPVTGWPLLLRIASPLLFERLMNH